MDYYDWNPYVRVVARRRQAAHRLAGLRKKGHEASPVLIEGRKIATTFWGKAWCENLERYSDFENRLPRGRTYVRNGSVIDLQMSPGTVTALVSGSEIYDVRVNVAVVPRARWRAICRECTGGIDSLVELLQGRLSTSVMARICEPKTGLFPAPKEISFQCSCPDWAWLCKHVAAVLYGIGARLDERPELLFLLRSVNQQDLIAKADTGLRPAGKRPVAAKVLIPVISRRSSASRWLSLSLHRCQRLAGREPCAPTPLAPYRAAAMGTPLTLHCASATGAPSPPGRSLSP